MRTFGLAVLAARRTGKSLVRAGVERALEALEVRASATTLAREVRANATTWPVSPSPDQLRWHERTDFDLLEPGVGERADHAFFPPRRHQVFAFCSPSRGRLRRCELAHRFILF